MSTNIDVATYTGVNANTVPSPTPTRKSDDDQLVQETYRGGAQDQREQQKAAEAKEQANVDAAQETRATDQVQKQSRPGTRSYDKAALRDKAEINFQLSMEERDVFLNAMSGKEEPSMMTRDEQTTLQRVSERIEKLIEEAESKSTDRVDRVESAIKEWYNRLSNGKYKAPTDLIQLIRLAASGTSDLSKIEL